MTAVGQAVTRIAGATLADGSTADLVLDGAVISAVEPCGPAPQHAPASAGVLDLRGYVLLPSAVEPHAHIDKAFSWEGTDRVYGDLLSAISSWHSYASRMTTQDVYQRARRALLAYLRNGFTAVRTHIDLLSGPAPLRGVEAAIRLRDEFRDVMHVEIVLLASSLSPQADVDAALDAGIDVIGGCPHLADDPHAETVTALDRAERAGLPVDLHTDEQLDPGALSILSLSDEIVRRGFPHGAAASHCVSLGSLDPDELAPVVERIAACGLAVVSLPITNLYLQGRDDPALTPRGITALRALIDAGVPVAAGADNLRDPFNPMGRADPFETTSLLITAGHLDASEALAAVTSGGRRALRLPAAGTAVGDRADLVAVRADNLADVLAGGGTSRVVLYRGRLVSRTTVTAEHALGALSPAW